MKMMQSPIFTLFSVGMLLLSHVSMYSMDVDVTDYASGPVRPRRNVFNYIAEFENKTLHPRAYAELNYLEQKNRESKILFEQNQSISRKILLAFSTILRGDVFAFSIFYPRPISPAGRRFLGDIFKATPVTGDNNRKEDILTFSARLASEACKISATRCKPALEMSRYLIGLKSEIK